MDREKKYDLVAGSDSLIFRTSSFRAEKTSVLHAGVYTKEFSAMLSASAASVLTYMVLAHMLEVLKAARYFITIASFAVVFLASRKFVFKESVLEAYFDRRKMTVSIRRPGILHGKAEEVPFDMIQSVETGSRTFVPENRDGIDFVQKISAQHGSAVPGLSDTEEFITLKLMLKDGSERTIYAVKLNSGVVHGEPVVPLNEIRTFLRDSHAATSLDRKKTG